MLFCPPSRSCRRPLQPRPEFLVTGIDPRIVDDLKREHLLKEGHWSFQYGGHSRGLIDRDHLLSDPVAASHMAYALAKHYFTDHIETVATPSIWGRSTPSTSKFTRRFHHSSPEPTSAEAAAQCCWSKEARSGSRVSTVSGCKIRYFPRRFWIKPALASLSRQRSTTEDSMHASSPI